MKRVVFALLLFTLAGCEGAKQDMYDQPRYKTYALSPLFEDGASARPPVAGTEPRARGGFADSSGGRAGTDLVRRDALAEEAQTNPYPVDMALLKRGQDRYMIYCMPCHSPAGDGDGLVVGGGFAAPPPYHPAPRRNPPVRYSSSCWPSTSRRRSRSSGRQKT